MLTVAPSAAQAIQDLVSSQGLPDAAGLRLDRAEGQNSSGAGYELSLAAQPDPADLVIDQDGAHVFLSPDAADALEGSTLEATAQDNQITFALG